MRNLLLALLLGLVLPSVVNAQDGDDSRYIKSGFFSPDKEQFFYGGFTAGANFTTVAGDNYGGYKKVGFAGGATVYVRLLPKMVANIELLYTMKGSRGIAQVTSVYSGEFFERYWLDLNYVEIPLIFHYNFTPRWHIGIGASYAQLVKTREEIYTDQPVVINPDLTQFNNSDINFIVSGGLQIGNGWFLMLRYQRSLQSIRQPQNIPVWQNSVAQYNDLFSLRLMYLID